jgi:hypothetical protein
MLNIAPQAPAKCKNKTDLLSGIAVILLIKKKEST